MKLNFRNLKLEDIEKLKNIDRSENIEGIYRLDNNKLVFENAKISLGPWVKDEINFYIDRVRDSYNNGGFVFGAFNKQNLLGFLLMDKKSPDGKQDKVFLDMIYVTNRFRQMDIGTSLMKRAIKEAKKENANSIYISSVNYKNSVDFFLGLGAEISHDIGGPLVMDQPNNIPLEIKLQ